MKYETEHAIGDQVYNIHEHTERNHTECALCVGMGEITAQLSGMEVECWECDGEGEVFVKPTSVWRIRGGQYKVSGIELRGSVSNLITKYFISDIDHAHYDRYSVIPSEIFTSKNEAQKVCDIKNGIDPVTTKLNKYVKNKKR
jgi:DnaJ-class molecular chaperone